MAQPPLDEIQYRRPDIIWWWVNEMGGQALDENMIHRYISDSPFFDHTSKNGLHFLQSKTNMAEFDLVKDRKRFEDDLARHVGTEYVIVNKPQEAAGSGPQLAKNGVWNLRKQYRDRKRDPSTGRMESELTTLGSYYIVGENMYQAPSVADVVGNRLLSAATSLNKFFDQAEAIPTFSPTAGYSYLSQSATQPSASAAGPSSQGSPGRSREGSVLPGIDSQSLRSTSVAPPEGHSGGSSAATQDARLLAQSFRMALEFGDEYMDENPLQGEPGHFSFTTSLAAVKKRKAAEEEAAALAAKAQEQKAPGLSSRSAAAMKTDTAPSPPAVMTEAKTAQSKERRGSKVGDRARRKKSRATIGTLAGLNPAT